MNYTEEIAKKIKSRRLAYNYGMLQCWDIRHLWRESKEGGTKQRCVLPNISGSLESKLDLVKFR